MAIDFVSGSDPFDWKGYFLAVVLLVSNVLKALSGQMAFKSGAVVGMRIRTAMVTAVYRKVGGLLDSGTLMLRVALLVVVIFVIIIVLNNVALMMVMIPRLALLNNKSMFFEHIPPRHD